MQNTVYECKQNGEVFFSSLCVTYSRFSNYPANGLVTEQPQYSVVVCIFHILQNTEIHLIYLFTITCFALYIPCRTSYIRYPVTGPRYRYHYYQECTRT